jgi:hypothetical protein
VKSVGFIHKDIPSCPTLTNKMHKLKQNKTRHKANFILGTNAGMFRHQGAILREFINSKGSLSPTSTSAASRPHFRRKN